jgi:hypothetical protein
LGAPSFSPYRFEDEDDDEDEYEALPPSYQARREMNNQT